VNDSVQAIREALRAGAAACTTRVREPDADHGGEWICSWLDALDVVDEVIADSRTGASSHTDCVLELDQDPADHEAHLHVVAMPDGTVLVQLPADRNPHQEAA
jgi:hypothetical protein